MGRATSSPVVIRQIGGRGAIEWELDERPGNGTVDFLCIATKSTEEVGHNRRFQIGIGIEIGPLPRVHGSGR